MIIPRGTISTNWGLRLSDEQISYSAPVTPEARNRLACELDRTADLLLAEGRFIQADRLSWHAAMLREAAQ